MAAKKPKIKRSRKRAAEVLRFIEYLPVPSGVGAGNPFKMRPFQRKFIRDIYEPHIDGKRCVRRGILSIGRKNGKSALIACLALAHLCGPECEVNGEIYSAATERDQAALVFKMAAQIVRATPELEAEIKIVDSTKTMVHYASGSFYRAISAEAASKFGFNPTFVIYDELAQARNRDLYDALDTSMGAREEPLFISISTQSADPNHILSLLIDDGLKHDDPASVVHLYQTPDDVDIWDEKTWYASNPALGDFRSIEDMRTLASRAKRMPSFESSFRNLFLNQRADPSIKWIARSTWESCEYDLDIKNYAGVECYGGLDLSYTIDFSACAWVFAGPDGLLDVFVDYWRPEDGLQDAIKHDRAPYDEWHKLGYLRLTDGKVIKLAPIAQRMAEIMDKADLKCVAYDRYRHKELNEHLIDMGIELPMQEHPQGFRRMGKLKDYNDKPIKDNPLWMPSSIQYLENLILEQKIRIAINPLLRWNVSNTVIREDPAGTDNKIFDKRRSTARIDGVVALAMAVGLAKARMEVSRSAYEDRGVLTF